MAFNNSEYQLGRRAFAAQGFGNAAAQKGQSAAWKRGYGDAWAEADKAQIRAERNHPGFSGM